MARENHLNPRKIEAHYRMMNCKIALLFAAAGLTASCSVTQRPTGMAKLQTVEKVDLSRYSGKWFEIARFPQWFQSNCISATAEYSRNPDGSIKVLNTCIRKDHTTRSVTGSALPVDATASRLKVKFTDSWVSKLIPIPDDGNYWIIEITPGYKEAIVGTPDRKFLWLLSRSPEISQRTMHHLKNTAAKQGFDTTKLVIDGHIKILR
jgi:apolipoprotein D and lipocalin family protein